MRSGGVFLILMIGCSASWFGNAIAAGLPDQASQLRPVAAFSKMHDAQARSAALFNEASRVITSPRCMNCHPATRQPTQGDDLHPHIPLMFAGAADHGAPGLPCGSCHGIANVATLGSGIASVPGNPRWSLAPASMAWQGKTPHEICEQIKDPSRNGGRSLAEIHRHMATDKLVGWAWRPGAGRAPAPGTQSELGRLVEAWISSGAYCPQA